MIGHFGFDTEYKNHINILSANYCIDTDSIFTIPDNLENEIKINLSNQKYNNINISTLNIKSGQDRLFHNIKINKDILYIFYIA